MRSRPRGSASTRSRKLPDQRKPSLRSKKENPPGPVETPATGPAAGPLSYPDAKIVTANGASRPSEPAINPDERSGLGTDRNLVNQQPSIPRAPSAYDGRMWRGTSRSASGPELALRSMLPGLLRLAAAGTLAVCVAATAVLATLCVG